MNPLKTRCNEAMPLELMAKMAGVLKLLAHPQRLKVVEILDGRDEVPVRRIAEWLGLPHAATSQHLNQMKRVGLLESERRGKEVWYRIADRRCITILKCIRGGH
ncbi:MAG: helix-turn-helix transcriptional regulator [Kiritimatiellae bacterium]|nr:helix-turn-helix transcriptional regulator [Kiritimatiellia bacterium]